MNSGNSLSEKQRLTEGPILKKIIAFVIPMFLSNIFQQMYNFADSAMVGRWVGSDALAAVGTCGIIFNVQVSLFIGFSTGAGIIIARHFGARRYDDMRKAIHTTVALSLIVGAILSVAAIFLSPVFLKAMKVPDNVMDYAVQYLRILSVGIIFMLPYNLGMGILRAVGDSKRPLYFLVISGVANVIFNAFFIYVCSLGVIGAALGTICAQLVTLILIYYRLISTNEPYRVSIGELSISGRILKEILIVGIPTAIQAVIGQFTQVILQSEINTFGSTVMAGVNIYHKIDSFIVVASSSFAMSIVTFVAQNMGAGKKDRVRKGIWYTVAFSSSLSLVMSVIAYFIKDGLAGIFTDDRQVLAVSSRMLSIVLPFFFLCGICEIISGAVKGMGHTKITMMSQIVFYCVLRMIWIAVMRKIWRDPAVIAIAYPMAWFVSTVFFLLYYRFKVKRELDAMPEETE